MKRHGNLFDKIVDIENLKLATYNAKKGKRRKICVKEFEKNEEENILKLQKSLIRGEFKTSEYKTKQIYEPKERTIYILPFYPDRIVQHAIMNVLEPIWDGIMIDTSYACRKNKGQHAGSKKCMDYVRKYDYCFKADIKKFYPSIKHDLLYDIIQKKIKCKRTLNLLKDIIYSIEGGQNVPIGNYVSQWFGNLFLNELDMMIKHKLKCKAYIRYCDDFVLFSNSKKELNFWRTQIEHFLNQELSLIFSKKAIFPVSQGVDFLGYVHFDNYILLRKSTKKRLKRKLNKVLVELKRKRINFNQFRSCIFSYLGWLKHANTYNLISKLKIYKIFQFGGKINETVS